MADRIDLDQAIVALLRLAVVEREERIEPKLADRKIEILLAETGLDAKQIAAITGKSIGAVRKTLQRAKK